MKPFVWKEGMTDEESKNGAYWERNMLALMLANVLSFAPRGGKNGWYRHDGEGYDGWSRVISITDGQITFHVPDDFEMGTLPEISPIWDGHTTEQKWRRVMDLCGIAAIDADRNT